MINDYWMMNDQFPSTGVLEWRFNSYTGVKEVNTISSCFKDFARFNSQFGFLKFWRDIFHKVSFGVQHLVQKHGAMIQQLFLYNFDFAFFCFNFENANPYCPVASGRIFWGAQRPRFLFSKSFNQRPKPLIKRMDFLIKKLTRFAYCQGHVDFFVHQKFVFFDLFFGLFGHILGNYDTFGDVHNYIQSALILIIFLCIL